MFCPICRQSSTDTRTEMHNIVSKMLSSDRYDGEVPPNYGIDKPVVCSINFRINALSAPREAGMVSIKKN